MVKIDSRGAVCLKLGKPTLEDAQKAVGGWIERIATPSLPKTVAAFCDEEGKLKGLPVNTIATLLLPANYDDFIVGAVVVCGMTRDGDIRAMTDSELEAVVNEINRIKGGF